LTYGGEFVAELGHPWSLCEIREVQKMMMLVWYALFIILS